MKSELLTRIRTELRANLDRLSKAAFEAHAAATVIGGMIGGSPWVSISREISIEIQGLVPSTGDHTFDDYKMTQPGKPAWRIYIGIFDKWTWGGVILNALLLVCFVFRRIFKERLRPQAGL